MLFILKPSNGRNVNRKDSTNQAWLNSKIAGFHGFKNRKAEEQAKFWNQNQEDLTPKSSFEFLLCFLVLSLYFALFLMFQISFCNLLLLLFHDAASKNGSEVRQLWGGMWWRERRRLSDFRQSEGRLDRNNTGGLWGRRLAGGGVSICGYQPLQPFLGVYSIFVAFFWLSFFVSHLRLYQILGVGLLL